MNNWTHKHVLTLANFSKEDYFTVLEKAIKFDVQVDNLRSKSNDLEGYLITSLFFEASTRTRNSFELAAKRLSAYVQSFSPSSSSLSKGETHLDTALTYSAMGSKILIIRHSSNHILSQIATKLDELNYKTSVLNAGDGFHSHPSQGLLDLYTLTQFFSPSDMDPNILNSKKILIIGDVLHSRVARSNIWALSAFGANIVLCGPSTLIPEELVNFLNSPHSIQKLDPIKNRGQISICRELKTAIKEADAAIVLRLQKERMKKDILKSINAYSLDFCLTPEILNLNNKKIPILHPGPINRDIEISSLIVDNYQNCLINKQVANGIPVRMALLNLLCTCN